jgi:hypothetical protein
MSVVFSYPHSLPRSQIILTLLQSGDAYLVDLRKKHRGRVELEEVQDDSDDESGASPRSTITFTSYVCTELFIDQQ